MHELQKLCLGFNFRFKECRPSVQRNAAVECRYVMIIELDPRVSIEALGAGYLETHRGMGDIVCDEELLDLVLEIVGNPTAHPQLDNIFVSRTEAVQDHPPYFPWERQGGSVGVFVGHWTLRGSKGTVHSPRR